MPYFLLENFKGGVDTRNNVLASVPGTLTRLENCHITPGGEIETRKAFVRQFWDADTDTNLIQISKTFGLAELNNNIYVFQDTAVTNGAGSTWGTGSTTVSTPYGDVTLTRQVLTGTDLANAVPGAAALDTLLDWDVFEGKLYVVAKDAAGNGTVQHFYDGARVTSLNAEGNALLCTRIRTYKDKVYGIQDTGIYFSAVGDPTDWNTTTTPSFAGFITTAGASSEGENLTGLEIYYDTLAIFSESGIQLWDMSEDPTSNTLRQVIRSAGLVGEATPRQYGSGDVMFLSSSGIRSLRARDSSNAGAVSDVGSPIDFDIQALMRTDFNGYAGVARSMLEETTGRLWMSFGDQIWVLSQFPGPDVSAWSKYIPERVAGAFSVQEMVQARGMMFIRDTANTIYLYGGADDNTYDEVESTVETPFLTMENPAGVKKIYGLDVVAIGSWEVDFNVTPDATTWSPVARIFGSTYGHGKVGMSAYTNALAIKFRSQENRRAVVSQLMIHYDLVRAD